MPWRSRTARATLRWTTTSCTCWPATPSTWHPTARPASPAITTTCTRASIPTRTSASGRSTAAGPRSIACPHGHAATGTDAHSISADPDFLDIAGADNILGYALVAGAYRDGGADDNFYLDAGSPAIDSGDSWLAPADRLLGQLARRTIPARRTPDRPTTTGPCKVRASSPPAARPRAGAGRTMTSTSPCRSRSPSTAPATPRCRSPRRASCNSAMRATPGPRATRTTATRRSITNRRIAPLWANLTTSNIFVDTTVAGQVTIRWQGTNNADGSPVNFDVVLFQNGDIRFDYGGGNTNLDPTVGLSYGNGWAYQLPSGYDGQSSLTNAKSLLFTLAPGFVRHGCLRVPGLEPRSHAADGREHQPGDHLQRRDELPDQPVPGYRSARPSTRSMPMPRPSTSWSRRAATDSAAPTTWFTP